MNNIKTIVKKEFLDIIRDRKTVLMTVLIPVIMMPLLFTFIFNQVADQNIIDEDNRTTIILESNSQQLKQFFQNTKQFKIIESKKPEKDAFDGKAKVYIKVEDDFENKLVNSKNPRIDFYYDSTSTTANNAVMLTNNVLSSYQKTLANNYLNKNGLSSSVLSNLNIKEHFKDESIDNTSTLLMGMLIPMFLVGYVGSGIVPISTDLGAGEKERGTLEPLLSTSVNRNSILIGKLIVVSFFGILTSVLSIVGLMVAFSFGMPEQMSISISLSPFSIFIMLLVSVLYVVFISAVMLLVSTYAKNSKEAGTYLTPCIMIPIILSVLTMYMEPNTISFMMMNIPVLNTVTIIKEIVVNQLNYTHLFITIGWSIVYIVIALVVAKKLYDKEEVIFRT